MNQRVQKGIRIALVLIPTLQTVITMIEQNDSKLMGGVLILGLVALDCAGAFCISFGERMFERLILVSGLGTLVMVLGLSMAALPVNWQTVLITVLFSVEFLLSILYAIGRKYWMFL